MSNNPIRTLETYIIRCGNPRMGTPTWETAMAALDAIRDVTVERVYGYTLPELKALIDCHNLHVADEHRNEN